MNKILTIAIPTYNRKEKLLRTLKIIVPQITEEIKLLILDNNSSYDIFEITNEIPLIDKVNIEIKKNIVNIGGNANIARCFEYTDTEWMWLLGDDDIPTENSVKIIMHDLKNKKLDDICMVKYSSTIDTISKDEEILGLEKLIDYLSIKEPQKGFGNFLFISNSLYNIKKLKNFTLYGYQYTNAYLPHLAILFFYLNKNKMDGILFLESFLITVEDDRDVYSSITVGLGILNSTKNMFFDISIESEKKMRKLFTLFTNNYRNNFVQLSSKVEKDKNYYRNMLLYFYKESSYEYSLIQKIEFHILYFIFDKPLLMKKISKFSKKFKQAIEQKEINLYERI
ncbi:glycosyltransferase [Cetobacterium sp. 2A]|uniref:glycosyltransferase family 2 protein n=1 Tax=Cetobacterium sp. 2A TaxID=2754723 RepID=UPI00163BCD9C|nr:glycosyltransferase [Cetobacterium sp. 2A]MBC2856161.1 glycosyltransferase [Cetobacterium sp. 2A]